MGQPRAQPSSPPLPKSSNLGAQAAQRGDGGGAAGQAEAAPGSALLHPGLGERKKGAVCLVSAADPAGDRAGVRSSQVGGGRGERARCLGTGGLGEALARDCIPRAMPTEVGGTGSCWQPKTENRGSFILAPCTLARNLTLSVLREPLFSGSSQQPPATCLLPSHTPPQAIPAKPWDAWNARPGTPSQASQGTYQLWGPKDGARGQCGCWGSQLQCPSFSGGAEGATSQTCLPSHLLTHTLFCFFFFFVSCLF